jgi:hypothetical protein
MLPELNAPISELTVWATAPVFVQQTVPPGATLTVAGLKPKS